MAAILTIIGFLTVLILGPLGIAIVLAIIFGVFLSNHFKLKGVYSDLQLIKLKLGIENVHNDNLSLDEEEEAPEDQYDQLEDSQKTELDLEIEKELEEYLKKG